MTRIRTLVLLASVVAVALAAAAPSPAAAPKLAGTVGPGFTITLKQNGKKVVALKAGTYAITVADKSNIHNYHLVGPGVNKEITSVGFVGTKTAVVKLKTGTYRYVCDPHLTVMKDSFKVT